MCPGINAISQAVSIPAPLLWTFLAIAARGSTIRAPNTAGIAATLHHVASSAGISSSQDSPRPPSARDQENSGGRGLIAPIG